ncbi:MAG: ABC transporter permease [Bacteroidetes bacterium]|nr:ABC transporter permease [Bacteroidota bacterium]
MIVSVAIVTGFQQEIRAKVIGFGAHIQISKNDDNHSLESEPIDINAFYVGEVRDLPEVEAVEAVASKPGIIKSGDAIEGVVYKGLSLQYDSTFLIRNLVRGRLPALRADEASKEVLISSTHARLLNLDVDSSFVMYFVQDPPKARKFSIAGIYNTGLGEQEFDKRFIFGDLRVVQKLNRWEGNQAGALEVNLKDFSRLDELEATIYRMVPADLTADSITRRYPQIFGWLELMDTNVYIIITLMLVVSVINMITSLLIMILERTRTIGLLKTMGATNRLVMNVFLRQAARIIGVGLLAGNILGIGFCLLQDASGLVTLNQETYYLSVVPVHLELWHILALNAFSFVVCLSILLLPALIITRIRPARVIRFD